VIESRVVQCLVRIANGQGYAIKQENVEYPLTDFTNKIIQISAKDMTVYHMVHEVAHIAIVSAIASCRCCLCLSLFELCHNLLFKFLSSLLST